MTDKTPRLPNVTNCPPGGWVYRVPETQKTLTSSSIADLSETINLHLDANGYPQLLRHELEALIEKQTCERLPDYCSNGPQRTTAQALAHTFHSGLNCLRTLAKHVKSGERVTLEQAESRAATCVDCSQKVEISGCTGCNIGTIQTLVGKIAGAKETKYDEQAKYCGVCDCANKAKVWISLDAAYESLSDEQRGKLPESCWMKRELREREAA